MRACYQSLGRPAGAPLATVTDAFLPAPNVVWEEYVNGAWRNWPVAVPAIGGLPGEDGELPTPAAFFQMLIGFVRDVIVTFPHDAIRSRAAAPDESILSRVRHLFGGIELPAAQAVDGSARSLIHAAYALADAIRNGEAPEGHQTVLTLIEECWRWFASEVMSEIAANDEARRLYILADLAVAMATGMVRDHVLTRGFTSIDDQDFAEWLTAHGASTLAQRSAPLRGFYDYFFAYDQGDPAKPRMSAAMGLYHLLRLVFTYKQSLFFKMASGMGDTVFGPLFEVCRRNGVRFEFFHEVRELTPDASANRITAIHLIRQVETKADYMPLRDVAGLPSWPSEPLYDQIRDDQAARLRESGVDLEDPWSGWDGGVDVKLLEGRDFDLVVLGIPVGAHRMICRGLIDRLPEWRQMTEALQTIQTGTLQLWWTSHEPPRRHREDGHRHRVRSAARELVGYVARAAARTMARPGAAGDRGLFLRPDADAGGDAKLAGPGLWRGAEGRCAGDGAAVVPTEPAASVSRRDGGSRSRLERAGGGQRQRGRSTIRRAVHPRQLHPVGALRARSARHVAVSSRRGRVRLRQPAARGRLGVHRSRRRRRVRSHRRDQAAEASSANRSVSWERS